MLVQFRPIAANPERAGRPVGVQGAQDGAVEADGDAGCLDLGSRQGRLRS
jgi:hypothetical protein